MAKKGSVFNKYSPELKLKVVEAYLSAQYGGGARVAKVFGVRSASQVKAWTKLYQTEGVESLSIDKRVNSNNPTLENTSVSAILKTGHWINRLSILKWRMPF